MPPLTLTRTRGMPLPLTRTRGMPLPLARPRGMPLPLTRTRARRAIDDIDRRYQAYLLTRVKTTAVALYCASAGAGAGFASLFAAPATGGTSVLAGASMLFALCSVGAEVTSAISGTAAESSGDSGAPICHSGVTPPICHSDVTPPFAIAA